MNFDKKLSQIAREIGNTPLIQLGGSVSGKLESRNPAGSVKDRAAFYIVKNAIESGALAEGRPVVEATSGNTGIGLAYVCGRLGIRVILAMSESMSAERRRILADMGAELSLTPAAEGMGGAVARAKAIADSEGGFFADQFANYSSVEAHCATTAPEIFRAVPDVKWIVAGVGSGGTAMGIKKFIAENDIDCKIAAVEPAESRLLGGGAAGPHKIQGIGANFIPALVDVSKLDEIIAVKGDEAVAAVKDILSLTGEKCGISSGAAFLAAKELSKRVDGRIVAILPDGGGRYPDNLYI